MIPRRYLNTKSRYLTVLRLYFIPTVLARAKCRYRIDVLPPVMYLSISPPPNVVGIVLGGYLSSKLGYNCQAFKYGVRAQKYAQEYIIRSSSCLPAPTHNATFYHRLSYKTKRPTHSHMYAWIECVTHIYTH